MTAGEKNLCCNKWLQSYVQAGIWKGTDPCSPLRVTLGSQVTLLLYVLNLCQCDMETFSA